MKPWTSKTWVLEPLRGYLMLAEQLWQHGPDFAGNWNFGPAEQDMLPVRFLVQTLQNLWGEGAEWQEDKTLNLPETHVLRLDCTKSRTILGWEPRLSLSQALEWIVIWYKGYMNQDDMQSITLQQIRAYQELLTR